MTDTLRPARDAAPRMLSYEDDRASYAPEVRERFNPVLAIVERWAREAPDDLGAAVARRLRRRGRGGHGAGPRRGVQAGGPRPARARPRQGRPRVRHAAPRARLVRAMLGAIRIGAVAGPGPEPAHESRHRLPAEERGGGGVDHRRAAARRRSTRSPRSCRRCRHRLRWAPGAPPAGGWLDFDDADGAAGDGATPARPDRPGRPAGHLLHERHRRYPKMVEQPQSYGLGHVATARFWHDLRPGDRHWTVSDTGWAKAAWGGLFGQWHERATVVQVALGKPDADTILRILAERRDHVVLRAADALPAARAGRPRPPRPLGACATARAPASRSTRR